MMLFQTQVPEVPGLTFEELCERRDAAPGEVSDRCECGLAAEGHSSPRWVLYIGNMTGGILPAFYQYADTALCPGFWRAA